MSSLSDRIIELENRIRELPAGTLTYKKIKGREQPYLQWTENGKTKSKYIKKEGRAQIIEGVMERKRLQKELVSLIAEYYSSGAFEVREEMAEYKAGAPGIVTIPGGETHSEPHTGSEPEPKLPLPVGLSDYVRAQREYYYVDKTMMIKEIIDRRAVVSLFTRPRRFGKTLNMSMLRAFFEKKDTDSSELFSDKAIWQCGERYRAYQGKYPVIYLTFKDIKWNTWNDCLKAIANEIRFEFSRHRELLESDTLPDDEKKYFTRILDGDAGIDDLSHSLRMLSDMLFRHYGESLVIIVDEYDTPIQQGYVNGYYSEVVSFMRNFFSDGFKDNDHLSFGFLTGILRVARESIFSGLNNLTVYSILDEEFSDYFGFTEAEVRKMLEYYEVTDKFDEVCRWYDGYNFGGSRIFNPWSVLNYIFRSCKPNAYWLMTSSNDIVGELLEEASNEAYDKLQMLLQGGSLSILANTNVVYPEIGRDPDSLYTFLLITGYLNAVYSEASDDGVYECNVALPNKELYGVFRREILDHMKTLMSSGSAVTIVRALRTGDEASLKEELEGLLGRSASYYNTVGELYYQGLLLGLTASLDGEYKVLEDRESGNGRYDIAMYPRHERRLKDLPGIIIEVKHVKDADADELDALASQALDQIVSMRYETDLRAEGVRNILCYGAAFSGKHTSVAKCVL